MIPFHGLYHIKSLFLCITAAVSCLSQILFHDLLKYSFVMTRMERDFRYLNISGGMHRVPATDMMSSSELDSAPKYVKIHIMSSGHKVMLGLAKR